MERIAHFEKITSQAFATAYPNLAEDQVKEIYEQLQLPKRATSGSAGYDFFSPVTWDLAAGETVLIATGLRVKIQAGWVLQLYPRSSFGFKYQLRLANTVGIIDSDYYEADNQGHIMIKVTNSGNKPLHVNAGQAFAQGIFVPYGITDDDQASGNRHGGFGSTDQGKM